MAQLSLNVYRHKGQNFFLMPLTTSDLYMVRRSSFGTSIRGTPLTIGFVSINTTFNKNTFLVAVLWIPVPRHRVFNNNFLEILHKCLKNKICNVALFPRTCESSGTHFKFHTTNWQHFKSPPSNCFQLLGKSSEKLSKRFQDGLM